MTSILTTKNRRKTKGIIRLIFLKFSSSKFIGFFKKKKKKRVMLISKLGEYSFMTKMQSNKDIVQLTVGNDQVRAPYWRNHIKKRIYLNSS